MQHLDQPDFQDQYISVLLEFYAVKEDLRSLSPMERARVSYWQKNVAAFEQFQPEKVRSRIRYRAGKAEARKLSPIQVAMVRYAWAAYYLEEESRGEVKQRWEAYFLGDDLSRKGKTVDYEVFRRKRLFVETVKEIVKAGLWPWSQ